MGKSIDSIEDGAQFHWCTDSRISQYQWLARHKVGRAEIRSHKHFEEIVKDPFVNLNHGDDYRRICVPKLISSLQYAFDKILEVDPKDARKKLKKKRRSTKTAQTFRMEEHERKLWLLPGDLGRRHVYRWMKDTKQKVDQGLYVSEDDAGAPTTAGANIDASSRSRGKFQ
jgi:hypothetical protein